MMSALVLSLGMSLGWTSAHAETVEAAPEEAASTALEESQTTAIIAGLVVQVDDRQAAIDRAIAIAEAQGGWFASLGTQQVSLRVPTAASRAVIEELRGLGDLIDRSFSSQDLGPQLVDLESRLKARREVLARYEAVLAQASPQAVVSVERQITNVVGEIEGIEGQLRVLRDRSSVARIDLSFQFRERRAPTRDGSSSFAWLNTLNVADVLADFQSARRTNPSRATVPTPEGFAAWKKRGRFQAVSPDDVVMRVRSAKNKPYAALTYWQEALRNRMKDAGYTIVSESNVSASGVPGVVLELGAANGEQDQTYLIGLFVDGRHLLIVEATGETTRFRARRDAIMAAISGMEP